MGLISDMVVRFRVFLCSYAPLFAICAIRFENKWLRVACIALTVVSVITGWLVIRTAKSISPTLYHVRKVVDRGPEVSGYLATYLLPFVPLGQPSRSDVIGYLVFLFFAALLYLRSEMIQVNPTLYLLGWRVVSITADGDFTAYMLTKKNVYPDTIVKAVRYKNSLLISYG